MKTKACLFLFIFISFLVTPTVVSIMNHEVDISYIFSLAEEENKKGEKVGKEVELDTGSNSDVFFGNELFKITFFAFFNLSIKAIYLNLISPPPKL